MSEHQPHIGDGYASNDTRDIKQNKLKCRTVTTVTERHVCFDGGSRRVSRKMLDTAAQRGYRLIYCAGEDPLAPERTYTLADIARAYDEGRKDGYEDAQAYHAFGNGNGCGPDWHDCTCPNPYIKQEEA